MKYIIKLIDAQHLLISGLPKTLLTTLNETFRVVTFTAMKVGQDYFQNYITPVPYIPMKKLSTNRKEQNYDINTDEVAILYTQYHSHRSYVCSYILAIVVICEIYTKVNI